MKNIVTLLFLLLSVSVFAQKYITKSGITDFKASVVAFEPVEAENSSTTAILDISNGDVAALLFVQAFHFKVALMEEHFNENYMDTHKFPKATFKGNIEGFQFQELTNESNTYPLNGSLTIKGISQAIDTIVQLKRVNGTIYVKASLSVQPDSFGIEIPGIVRDKIAKNIIITMEYELVKKN